MRLIDLRDFAAAKKKLPPSFLHHHGRHETPTKGWKIFAAFALDSYLIFAMTSTLFLLLSASTNSYMITSSLSKNLLSSLTDYAFFSIFFLTMFGYYFSSFYFNAGQTYGMFRFKHRIATEHMSLRSSLHWTAAMAFISFSWGMLLHSGLKWMEKEGWGKVANHDHLYLDLIADKEIIPMDLVAVSSRNEEPTYVEEFKEVA